MSSPEGKREHTHTPACEHTRTHAHAQEHASAPQCRASIPRATYRVQLGAAFTFRDATALVPYLAALGVSHVYCSPYLRARPGSTHGYDIVDHNSLNPEIGDRQELERFVAALRAHRMGHLLDFVPNHVGIMGADNAWWMDVLENGAASIYAPYFDIDWEPGDPALEGKVLVPVLGGHYGEVLERGELAPRFEPRTGSFAVWYHEHRFPLDPRDYPALLRRALELAPPGAPPDALTDAEREEVASLAAAFGHLPDRRAPTAATVEERNRDKEIHKRRLAELVQRSAPLANALAGASGALAGQPGDAGSWDGLHRLLESQAYRLAYWRVASDEVNYRRFFDVNDLAALRMENEAVFEATHALVFELLARGLIDGLRIDHPDGLYDPAQYFERLQSRAAALALPAAAGRTAGCTAGNAAAAVSVPSLPQARSGGAELPLYLVAEKITAAFEHLPRAWPVHGTTGYRFANVVNGLLIDGRSRARFDRIYRTFSGDSRDWGTIAYESKRLIIETSLASELNILAQTLTRIARASRRTRDLTFHSLKSALAEIIACFPVYRTYIVASASSEDRRYIEWAVAAARRRGAAVDTAVYDFTRGVLLGENAGADLAAAAGANPEIAAAARAFTMKFQQVTAPAVAKGVEDTALYRFDRLIAVNEVGGDPEIFGVSVRAFHADAQRRAREWPHELNATSTHDTKRSEDVRARIAVLTEMPAEWRRSLVRWSRMNRARRREVDGAPAPSRTDEYLLYQTLVGTLPLEAAAEGPPDALADRSPSGLAAASADAAPDAPRASVTLSDDYRGRIEAYMIKAAREAKSRSSWSSIDAAYEAALVEFVRGALEPRPGNLFLPDIVALTSQIARAGLLNALTQTLCKLTAPGIPDLYQGTELWDFSLVDPDNRRAVDYELRRRRLAELEGLRSLPRSELAGHARALAESLADGRAKLYVIWRALQCRRAAEDLYAHGEYLPLAASGVRAAHLCAFARRRGGEVAITIAPRLYLTLARECAGAPLGDPTWGDTHIELPEELPTGMLDSVFDGARVRARECGARRALLAKEVLASFPVALLTGTLSQQQPPPP